MFLLVTYECTNISSKAKELINADINSIQNHRKRIIFKHRLMKKIFILSILLLKFFQIIFIIFKFEKHYKNIYIDIDIDIYIIMKLVILFFI